MMHVGGYLEYHEGCSVQWGELTKISRFEGFDSQDIAALFCSSPFFPVLS